MPSATRQATPGPGPSSSARSNAKSLKRSHTAASSTSQGQATGTDSSKENAPDGREQKKMRMDPNAAVNTGSTTAPSVAMNGRRNARSASVVSSTAETGQQNGERGGRAKNKRKRKKKRTPVVVQGSSNNISEIVVTPSTHQRRANQSQSQPSQGLSLPASSTGDEQSRSKERERKKKKSEAGEVVDSDGDASMEATEDHKGDCNEEGGDNNGSGHDEPPPPNEKKEDDEDDDQTPRISSSEKGKGKARMETPGEEGPRDTAPASSGDHLDTAAELARLREELARQTSIVNRHQNHLNQSQQSLTCQICLDLLHRPYALSPCGHVTCYPCLVRWFTAPRNPNANEPGPSNEAANEHDVDHLLDAPTARRGAYIRRNKTCPLCRTVVSERPVEMWTIKAMVASLVRSGLSDLPVPPPTQPEAAASNETTGPGGRDRDADPWRNVFRKSLPAGTGAGGFLEILNGLHGRGPGIRLDQIFGQNAQAVLNGNVNRNANANGGANQAGNAGNNPNDDNPAQVGMFDQEDGIYRCIQCMHEIWNGVCTACHRRYPAHRALMDRGRVGGRAPRRQLATANANRRGWAPDSDSDDIDPGELAMDDNGSDDGALRAQEIEDHNNQVMRTLMGDDIDDDEDDEDDEGYPYDALERALAGEHFDDDDHDEDEDDMDGPFADIPIWQDWHVDSDDDMEDFYVDEIPGFEEAIFNGPDFAGRRRMHRGGHIPVVGLDHTDSEEDEESHSEDEESQYGGSFIVDDDAVSQDEDKSESENELDEIDPRHRRILARAERHVERIAAGLTSPEGSDSDSGSNGEVEFVAHGHRRTGPNHRTRVIVDDDDDEAQEEVEVVSELRGAGNAAASGSGSNRESRTRSQTAARPEENARPTPAAAAAAAAMRRARQTMIISDDDEAPRTRHVRTTGANGNRQAVIISDDEEAPRTRSGRSTGANGSGNTEAGPSRSSRTLRRR
ncbi:hypothetical protein BJ165DRAFT_1611587 [Panaeolus papilionaceus]|nr:hypothetical protein BJ165DRAFT_1611587 [Panaeolus papilionaceus]